MKTVYRVTVVVPGAARFDKQITVGSAHYAVREVLFSIRHQLPRGWKTMHVEVSR